MEPTKRKELEVLALKVREHIIRLSTDGGCFTGASLSCADIFVYLYASGYLNLDKNDLKNPNRDYVFLSKGHDVPALYGTLAEIGFMERDRLKNHLKANDHIYWHPNRNIPGIEYYSGSLGHIPAVALGVAADCRMSGQNNRVLVITGDGELNEGTVWETLLVASAKKMHNFTLVVDRNWFQANIRTEELIPLEPLAQKFEAFGCEVKRINGHDFDALEQAFAGLPFHQEKPSVIICDTQRGKGLPSITERADRWFCNFTHEEVEALLKELHGEAETNLTSETLVVR